MLLGFFDTCPTGISYLHSESMVHMDLKTDNILVEMRSTGVKNKSQPVCKIADLGLTLEMSYLDIHHSR